MHAEAAGGSFALSVPKPCAFVGLLSVRLIGSLRTRHAPGQGQGVRNGVVVGMFQQIEVLPPGDGLVKVSAVCA